MKKILFKGLFLTALISNSVSAFAVVDFDPFAGAPCLTTQNSICVQEIGDQNGGQYQITNNSNQEIFMFGVTNSNATNAYSTEEDFVLDGDSVLEGYWFGKTITKDEWNNTDQLFGAFKIGLPNGLPGAELYRHNGRELGTFESLFGTEDTAVNMYWHIQGSAKNHLQVDF